MINLAKETTSPEELETESNPGNSFMKIGGINDSAISYSSIAVVCCSIVPYCTVYKFIV